jgi:type IV pilus assembly protein PilC
MILSPRASYRELAVLARSLGTSLHAGIDIVRAFELAARKCRGRMKFVLDDVVVQLKAGQDVTSAFEAHDPFFPELFVDMIQAGEGTGALPEVLLSLANHYENNIRLKKDFIGQITLPAVQLAAAVFIVAGLIYLLGWVASMTGEETDILGWGLLGGSGALVWLGGWALGIVAVWVGYQMLTASLAGQKAFHRFLMRIPVIGTCLRSFAIARFSWAFHLTQQAGMPIDESLEASLRATSNGAFIAATDDIIRDVNAGASLTEALEGTQLFPAEFMQIVHVAETSGTVPEALDRLSPQFEEDARRSLRAMATALGWAIWAAVAAFIVYIIFTIALWYIGMLNEAIQGT